jgi:transcriptional regulator with XRE-family HTH domain
VDFQTGPARDASRAGDYGRVIELARKGRQMTQAALGQALGMSQSAVSRLEKRGPASYSTNVLTAAAAHLQIPPALVGLADGRQAQVQARDDDPMHRRTVLGGAVAAMAAPILAALPDTHDRAGGQAAALRLTTSAYRRLDGTTPSRDLADAVDGHIRLIQTTRTAASDADRARLAAVGSEAASFAG